MKKKYPRLSLQQKILVVSFLILIVPTLLIAPIVININIKGEIENSIGFMNQMNMQVNSNINAAMDQTQRVIFINEVDYKVESVLYRASDHKSIQYIENLTYMSHLLRTITWLNSDIYGISMIGHNNEIYSTIRRTDKTQEQFMEFIDLLKESGDNTYISPMYNGKLLKNSQKEIISVVHPLYSMETGNYFGYICIDLDFKNITNRFSSEQGQEEKTDLLVVQNQNIIFQTNNDIPAMTKEEQVEVIARMSENMKEEGTYTFQVEISNSEYLFTGMHNKEMGLNLLRGMPYNGILSNMIMNMKLYIIYFSVIIMLIIIAVFYMYNSIRKTTKKLDYAMKKIQVSGEFSTIEGYDNGKDEIDQLVLRFNKMSNNLQETLEREKEMLINKRKIEIKMLQFQINPHFLYNTLNTISSIAELNDVEEITTISVALSEIFRYNVKGTNIVTIRQEIHQIQNYINIQKIRFPEKIEEDFYVEEEVMDMNILKFMLQPLVENSIYHGIEPKSEGGFIKIRIYQDGWKLYIKIIDNGVGMTAEAVRTFQNDLNDDYEHFVVDDNMHSLGIKNVHYRVKRCYGMQYGVSIISNEYGGITMEIILPIVELLDKESEEYASFDR